MEKTAKRFKAYLLALVVIWSLLCIYVYSYEATIDFTPPEYVEEMEEIDFIDEFAQPGSLFGSGDRPIFSDRRAMKPDDLITIIIDESGNASLSLNKNYSRNSGGASTAPNIAYGGNNEGVNQAVENIRNNSSFNLTEPTSNSTFQGGGAQNKNSSVKNRVTARIIKVLKNGNYYIEGKREMLVDGEKEIVRVSGVVRPYDISRDNSVNSNYIADAKIEYSSYGSIRDKSSKRGGSEAIDSQWPY